ncbi:MAG: hypothetical protein KDB96_07230 [Flavobacteriales bacterium]|nr:hypothetical protein [Flavobacteriales bacterium]MCB0785452.1 hypothetical protein [Flavobacteriales bacterium]MCB0788870.1 hypothetical protein [Flavobacteriales bacterium]MCB0809060.1 hypothetical protein [Flavobacteriales bacterium]MCB0811827.1 hypothetical protein [Flavobacteriales bacterium]
MDKKALRLEIQQRLASAEDADLLSRLKRRLDLLLGQGGPDASAELVQEPEPIPVLRAEVKRLIDEVRDVQVLSSVLAFLRGDEDELVWRSALSARAARAEADFAAGRVYTQEQVEARFKSRGVR